MTIWECFKDYSFNEDVGCSFEIVYVWNDVSKGNSENQQRSFLLNHLQTLKDRMNSGCAHVGLVKYGSCAYIRHELSTDYDSVREQLLYIEGSDASVDSAGLGDGYSNLLAAYYQVYQVLNNPATSLPAGNAYPYQRYKRIVMSINDVWGLDWDANYPAAPGRVYTSGAVDGTTGNPGFTATQPDDHQILYESTTYPAPTYYMNPMSWAAANPPILRSTDPYPNTLSNPEFNMVRWDPGAPFNCHPDMGQAQTWYADNIMPTINGQIDNWPGPYDNPFTNLCDNCYSYLHPVNFTNPHPERPSKQNKGQTWFFVMDGQMDNIVAQYNAIYGNSYVQTNGLPTGVGWPPTIPLANFYFDNSLLIPNQCGTDKTTSNHTAVGGDVFATLCGDGIYLPTGDFGDGTTGQWFRDRIHNSASPATSNPTCVSGFGAINEIWMGAYECSDPIELPGAWTCPEGYTLVYQNGEWVCCLLETAEPILGDQYLPIDLDDEFYFKDISWTVSYDPKAKAWISFHDWHPELCLPSINHFLTTKTFESDEVQCPPGYVWNPTIELCEKSGSVDLPAIIDVDEIPVEVNTTGNTICDVSTGYFDKDSDPAVMLTTWTRFCFNANRTIGKSGHPTRPTGLSANGNIDDVPPGNMFYRCSTNPADPNYIADCRMMQGGAGLGGGEFGYATGNAGLLYDFTASGQGTLITSPMIEGQNIGPKITPTAGIGGTPWVSWYFNSDIQKYVVIEDVNQSNNKGWMTYNPLADTGQVTGDPTAYQGLTTIANWSLQDYINPLQFLNTSPVPYPVGQETFPGSGIYHPNCAGSYTTNYATGQSGPWGNRFDYFDQYTINASNTVVLARVKNALHPQFLQCRFNSHRANGFYSVCNFQDYTHEVTLSAFGKDGDDIGIVIAAYKDVNGDYGIPGFTHNLMLQFRLQADTVYVQYNYHQSALAFNDSPGVGIAPTNVSSLVLRTVGDNPFGEIGPTDNNSYYPEKGAIRVKIKKTGANIKIYTTRTMGDPPDTCEDSAHAAGTNPYDTCTQCATGPGDSNPYIWPPTPGGTVDAPMFDFDLDDSATWLDVDPSLVVGQEDALEKFIDNSKIGYWTVSQPGAMFYDVHFEGVVNTTTTCECAPGFTMVFKDFSTGFFTEETGACNETDALCRKIECDCPPPPVTPSTLVESGVCDSIYETSADGASGSPNYINENPRTCHYDYNIQVPGSMEYGSIWKHNQRCDSFVNYYGTDYPWEIEFVETTGQAVNTVRSLEYQLESYIYKGNDLNEWNCGDDRWSDLDWNFDEAIIYNIEQVSGLLKLNLSPKGDPITALQYPIIGTTDIQILYTKEEQKYRLNQFWDITKDRGEFTNVQQQIWITHLNGYIRDLNSANLNYGKFPTQRKKFRSYYNRVILRRVVSGSRKMLLKLVNTKLNLSFR